MDLKEYRKRFEKANKDFDAFCISYLTTEGIKVRDEAKDRSPVDTGFMRSQWQSEKAKKNANAFTAKVFNNTNYTSFLEYGTRRGIQPYNMVTVPAMRCQRNAGKRFDKAYVDFCRKEGIY